MNLLQEPVEVGRVSLMALRNSPADCLYTKFASYTLMNLFLGWWGTISFFATFAYILNNFTEYGEALLRMYRKRNAQKKALSQLLGE